MIAVVVIVVVIVGALAALGTFSPKTATSVDITAVNFDPLADISTCWAPSVGAGGTVNPGSNFLITWKLSVKEGSPGPESCTVESVSVRIPGFAIVSANIPLVVDAGENQTLTVVLGTPATAYTGNVTIDLVVEALFIPIGSAFAAGNPVASTCASGGTPATTGCTAGDWTYSLTIETSAVSFGSVLFVVHAPTGNVFPNSGAADFAILTVSDTVAAYSTFAAAAGLAMTTTWADYEGSITSSTSLTTLYSIVIDMGQSSSTTGLGLTFVAEGTGSYSGTTEALALP